VEERNRLDGLVYSTEKSLKEFGDKIDAASRSSIEAAMDKAKEALKGEDVAAIRSAFEGLTQASHRLAEEMYKKAGGGGEGGPSQGGGGPAPGGKDEGVVDADFEEVK
jgi:molecular chaperone DnaK